MRTDINPAAEKPSETPQSFAPARGTDFNLLWLGESVSLLGNATTSILMPVLAVTQFGAGPAWMGILTAAAWLPWLVIGLPAGAWIDRWPPRAVMLAADLVSAGAIGSVPIVWSFGSLRLAHLLVVTLIGGIAAVFFRTAYVKLLPIVVPSHQLESANARLFGTESAAQIAGPGLGGLLTQLMSAVLGLAVDALSFVVSAVCLWRIRPRGRSPEKASADQLRKPGLLSEIRTGVQLVARDRHLRVLVLIGGASNFGLTGYGALLILFLVRELSLSSAAAGTMLMLGAAGGLLGAFLARPLANRLGNGRASTILMLVGGPSALLVGLPSSQRQMWVFVLGLILVGAAVEAGNVIRSAWRQRYVPAGLMGRVVTTSQVVNYGTMPLAGLVAGWLGSRLGVQATIEIMAGIHAVACWSILLSSIGRRKTLPDRTTGAP
jgi:MFS family permease